MNTFHTTVLISLRFVVFIYIKYWFITIKLVFILVNLLCFLWEAKFSNYSLIGWLRKFANVIAIECALRFNSETLA